MKIKAIAQLCKQQKRIMMYEDDNRVQWVGDGYAMYPLFELPHVEKESMFAIFDIPEKQRNRILFNDGFTPTGISLEDIFDGEIPLSNGYLGITKGGLSLVPLMTQTGLIFINAKYLAPASDIDDITLYERMSSDGRQYIVLKSGMYIYGAVMPTDIIDDDFVNQMHSLSNQCRVALDNKKASQDKNDNQMKIVRFDLGNVEDRIEERDVGEQEEFTDLE